MKYLKLEDLPKIKNTVLRNIARKTIKKGLKIPYSILYVGDREPTAKEVKYGKTLEPIAKKRLKKSNSCQLKVKPFKQCCCKCQYLLKDMSHPTTDGKAASHLRGYICAAFAYEGIAHSGWSKHSCGCEMYTEKKKARTIRCSYCHNKFKTKKTVLSITSRCPVCVRNYILGEF